MNTKVNLDRQFGRFHDHWHPRIVATVNDYDVKLVKVQGEFVWHQHDDTDELFLVVDGQLRIQLQDYDDVVLGAGRAVCGAAGGAPLSRRRPGDPRTVSGAAGHRQHW